MIKIVLLLTIVAAVPTASKPKCDKVADVGFILDSSGSLARSYKIEKRFLKSVAAEFGVRKNGARLSVITFSARAELSIKLKDHFDLKSFFKAVDAIPLMGRTTRIDLALRIAQREMFARKSGGRLKTAKILILLTDGSQTKRRGFENPALISKVLRKKGIHLIVVGIGPGSKHAELVRIAGISNNAYSAASFGELISKKFTEALMKKACKEIDVNECTDGSHKCHAKATCTNTVGSYTCKCKIGYTGNGRVCGVNGAWGRWSSYGACSKKCGNGKQTRRRSCNHPAPGPGGLKCRGISMQQRTCKTKECPVQGGWGRWSSYGACSKPCGSGKETRRRSCNHPAPLYGGSNCRGRSYQQRTCNTRKCGAYQSFPNIHFVPSGPNDIWVSYSNLNSLKSLAQKSSYCKQEFYSESFEISPGDVSFWGNGKRLNSGSSSCHKCSRLYVNSQRVTRGVAYIDDKRYLPIEKVSVGEGSMDDSYEYVKITLRNMVCR